MSNYKERALDILNNFVALVPEVPDDAQNKSDYVYAWDPDSERDVEVSFRNIAKTLPQLEQGDVVTTDDIVEAILTVSNITDASESFKDNIYEAVESSFGIQYKLADSYLSFAKKNLRKLNEEAGQVVLKEEVLELMLGAATEFYESSRCW